MKGRFPGCQKNKKPRSRFCGTHKNYENQVKKQEEKIIKQIKKDEEQIAKDLGKLIIDVEKLLKKMQNAGIQKYYSSLKSVGFLFSDHHIGQLNLPPLPASLPLLIQKKTNYFFKYVFFFFSTKKIFFYYNPKLTFPKYILKVEMDVSQTIAGKKCKLCLKKGLGEKCHLHCSTPGRPSRTEAVESKSSAKTAKRRPRASPKSGSKSTTPSPRSGMGKKKGRVRASPETPPGPTFFGSPMELGSLGRLSRSLLPPLSTGDSMEREWRLGKDSPGMRSLDWNPTDAEHYRTKKHMEHIQKRSRDPTNEWLTREQTEAKQFPREFEVVYDKLMEICATIPDGFCEYHPMTPAIQWNNNNNDATKTKETWKDEMHAQKNHYAQKYPSVLNSNYPSYDNRYCMCNEIHPELNAYKTLLLRLDGSDEEWKKIHGCFGGLNCRNDFSDAFDVSRQLREKIIDDSIEYLAQEYKIHLQPKPEYQFPVLRILAKLLATDKEFNAHVVAWKAVIPYHRVKTELNLPVIVIYPVWGSKSAEIVLRKIIKAFVKYDATKIGLNHTPRFNKKYNALIYYTGGSGDQKKKLNKDYFTPGKVFYIDHELKL